MLLFCVMMKDVVVLVGVLLKMVLNVVIGIVLVNESMCVKVEFVMVQFDFVFNFNVWGLCKGCFGIIVVVFLDLVIVFFVEFVYCIVEVVYQWGLVVQIEEIVMEFECEKELVLWVWVYLVDGFIFNLIWLEDSVLKYVD